MNHLTARCGCGAIVKLPSIKARASAAKCDACARKHLVNAVSTEKPPEPRIHADQVYVMSQPGFEQHFARLFDAHKDSGPPGCECPPCADRREQRASQFTEEKRRDGWVGGVQLENPADAVHFTPGYGARTLYPAPNTLVLTERGAVVPPDGATVPLPLPAYWQGLLDSGLMLFHDPRKPAPNTMTVTSVDREKGVVTFSSGSALRDMSGMGAASFEPSMAVERVVPAGHPLAGLPIESRYVMSGVDRLNPRGLDAWLPKPGDGASFLGVDRSKPAELNAETFLAALMRDPPAPQPVYLHPREYEEMQRTVADQLNAAMYAPTTPAGKWATIEDLWQAGFLPGSPVREADDDCDCCPCCCECGSDE